MNDFKAQLNRDEGVDAGASTVTVMCLCQPTLTVFNGNYYYFNADFMIHITSSGQTLCKYVSCETGDDSKMANI